MPSRAVSSVVEHCLHTAGVAGSKPAPRILPSLGKTDAGYRKWRPRRRRCRDGRRARRRGPVGRGLIRADEWLDWRMDWGFALVVTCSSVVRVLMDRRRSRASGKPSTAGIRSRRRRPGRPWWAARASGHPLHESSSKAQSAKTGTLVPTAAHGLSAVRLLRAAVFQCAHSVTTPRLRPPPPNMESRHARASASPCNPKTKFFLAKKGRIPLIQAPRCTSAATSLQACSDLTSVGYTLTSVSATLHPTDATSLQTDATLHPTDATSLQRNEPRKPAGPRGNLHTKGDLPTQYQRDLAISAHSRHPAATPALLSSTTAPSPAKNAATAPHLSASARHPSPSLTLSTNPATPPQDATLKTSQLYNHMFGPATLPMRRFIILLLLLHISASARAQPPLTVAQFKTCEGVSDSLEPINPFITPFASGTGKV